MFFFEKKNQKTFFCLASCPTRAVRPENESPGRHYFSFGGEGVTVLLPHESVITEPVIWDLGTKWGASRIWLAARNAG
jgi:hypothetical protein